MFNYSTIKVRINIYVDIRPLFLYNKLNFIGLVSVIHT